MDERTHVSSHESLLAVIRELCGELDLLGSLCRECPVMIPAVEAVLAGQLQQVRLLQRSCRLSAGAQDGRDL